MLARFLALLALVAGARALGADVYYEEEVTNMGLKTTHKVYIKGGRQKVQSEISTDKKRARALRKHGQPLHSSTILRLGKGELYQIDLDKFTFTRSSIPPPRAGKKAAEGGEKGSGAPVTQFGIKETGDTTRIAGILCHKVVAHMATTYVDSRHKKPLKENRYVYTAWIARDFPGYTEIRNFEKLQREKTSYPSLISGSLKQIRAAVEDYEHLVDELEMLEGFVMASRLKVSIKRPKKKERTIFQVDHRITRYTHTSLPDSLFAPSRALTRIDKK